VEVINLILSRCRKVFPWPARTKLVLFGVFSTVAAGRKNKVICGRNSFPVKELRYLNKYFLKYRKYLIWGIAFVTISNIFQILPAQLVRFALDLVLENLHIHQSLQGLDMQHDYRAIINRSIVFYGILILSIAMLRGLFLFLVRQTLIVMSRHIEYDLKNEIYRHYQSLPLSFYRSNNTGDLIARISEDVSKVRMYVGPAVMYGLQLFTLFIILIPIMFAINAKLTLWALLPLPLLSLSIYLVNNVINRRSEEIQKSLSDLSTFVQEAFSGIRVLKSFAREADSLRQFESESEIYRHKSLQLYRVNALFFPLMLSLIGLSTILTVYIGGAEVIRGQASIGNIAEFILYVNLLTWPVTSLGWITSIVQRAAASQKRINEFLLTRSDIVSDENLRTPIQGQVEFRSVSFYYPGSSNAALSDISFRIQPGQCLAVIGTTGSGKSTIANLISRLYDASAGEILIDGTDIRRYDPAHLRSAIGYVPQDVFLFSDTIAGNVAFGARQLSPEQVERALRSADLYDNVMEFPGQLNTILGERGITLSGGQKQRLSIARAIVREPNILILDDCLSAVDTKTENAILHNLSELMRGRTSLIISHRVSSAKLADWIVVIDNGCIVEEGDNTTLMAKNGVFKTLYEKQLLAESLEP
jgi:ATP-binding cassette, subfamily B, multidrug efflux pump